MSADTPTGGVMVIGADGFVGRHVASACLARDWTVHAVVLPGHDAPAGTNRIELADWADTDSAIPILHESLPASIINCAGTTPRTPGLAVPQGLYEGNVALVWDVLCALDASGLEARLLTLSSAAVYAESNEALISESSFVHPSTHYGASKLAAEVIARRFAEEDLDVVVARPFNILGPGEPPGSVVSEIVGQVAGSKGEHAALRLRESGSVRDFVDVRDVADALAILASSADASGIYNICTGQGVSVTQIVERACGAAGVTFSLELSDPDASTTRFVGDPDRLKTLGWEPSRSLDQTLADMLGAAGQAS